MSRGKITSLAIEAVHNIYTHNGANKLKTSNTLGYQKAKAF